MAFLDVGQGDSIFIETPEGFQVLIDGGPDSSVLRELQKIMPFFDRSIDMVIATHPDRDHIGGLPDIFKRFQVATYISTGNKSDSGTFLYLQKLVEEEHSNVVIVDKPTLLNLGSGISFDVLFPNIDASLMESNSSSIVGRLIYGEHEFLFTGDLPKSIEKYLVSIYGNALESDILKVGHHGSKTSSSEIFIETVNPQYAIISAGIDNRYGHPHKDVINTFVEEGVDVISTLEVGSIVFQSDGTNLIKK